LRAVVKVRNRADVGWRRMSATSSASTTSLARSWSAMEQPTTVLENSSMTTAT